MPRSCVNGWVGGCINGCVNGCINGCVKGWVSGCASVDCGMLGDPNGDPNGELPPQMLCPGASREPQMSWLKGCVDPNWRAGCGECVGDRVNECVGDRVNGCVDGCECGERTAPSLPCSVSHGPSLEASGRAGQLLLRVSRSTRALDWDDRECSRKWVYPSDAGSLERRGCGKFSLVSVVSAAFSKSFP